MAKELVNIDREIVDAAAGILGTTTVQETVDAALQEILDAKRRLELVAMLGDSERFDLSAIEGAWGGDQD